MARTLDKLALIIFSAAIASRLFLLHLHFSGPMGFSAQYETYDDFNQYYVTWMKDIGSGLLPYRDFFYQYPPLFLYCLYPLYYLAGAYGLGFGIVAADAGSAVLIYLIARSATTRRVAMLAGFGYALSPFALLYEGYVLFSLEPVLFFMLLFIFLLRRGNILSSAACFAVAVLFKQQAIVLLPAYLIYARKFDLKTIGKAAVASAGVLFLASLPFLVASPFQYLLSITYHPVYYISNSTVATAQTGPNSVCFYTQNFSRVVENCVINGTTSIFTESVPLTYQAVSITNQIFRLVLVPIAFLLLPALYVFRKRPSFLELSAAYTNAASIAVVAYLASYVQLEQVARYSYLPTYALLLLSGVKWQSEVAAVGFATVSLLLPPGIIQMVLPFLAILGVMAIEDVPSRVGEGSPKTPH